MDEDAVVAELRQLNENVDYMTRFVMGTSVATTVTAIFVVLWVLGVITIEFRPL